MLKNNNAFQCVLTRARSVYVGLYNAEIFLCDNMWNMFGAVALCCIWGEINIFEKCSVVCSRCVKQRFQSHHFTRLHLNVVYSTVLVYSLLCEGRGNITLCMMVWLAFKSIE